MAQVFVTGGSGFIGQVLVGRLLSEGHSVSALVRSEESAAKVSAVGAEPVQGELTDPATWQDEVTGSDVLFHLAAETDISAGRARQELVTVGGTRAAVDAARYAVVSRLVYCGTEAALMAGDPLVDVDETAPLRPDSEAVYCAVKAEAERIVLDANAPGLATVSIRPRMVWGPGSMLTDMLIGLVKAGQFAWIEGGRHTTDVTFVDNCVEARPTSSPTSTASPSASSGRPCSTSTASTSRPPNWAPRPPPVRSPCQHGGSSGRHARCGPTRPPPSSDTSPSFHKPPAWTPSGTR